MFFVDLKAAFDKVDRSKLWKELRRKKVKKDLVRRVEKTYEDTYEDRSDDTDGARTY